MKKTAAAKLQGKNSVIKNAVSTRKLVQTALLISIGVMLPMAFHAVPNAGGIFLPMHIPVLLCGLICGFPLGLISGLLTPVLSCLLTGMPPVAILPSMTMELAVYGAVSALFMRLPIKNFYARIYISLGGAMLCGRLVSGVLNALIFRAGKYSFQIWIGAAFVTSLPGIIIQILVVPSILIALKKAKLVDFSSPKLVQNKDDTQDASGNNNPTINL